MKRKTVDLRVAILATILSWVAVASFTACSAKSQEPFKDAPRSGTDSGSAVTVEMPDGFSNAAAKCLVLDGHKTGVLLVSAYHGDHTYAAVTAVPSNYCK
jgi:hypothetical protein